MGTRHLIAVQIDGAYKIAQYGQWDGYPSGQGATVLEFLAKMDRPLFEQKIRAASFLDEGGTEEINAIIEKDFPNGGWQKRWPELTRDTGAEILELVQNAPAGIKLRDSISFAGDSVFCEYAYVIDLDKNTLEVFKGFNNKPLDANERFINAKTDGRPSSSGELYYPVRLAKSYPLDLLPTVERMKDDIDPPEADEDAA